jgi:hypothetical protein
MIGTARFAALALSLLLAAAPSAAAAEQARAVLAVSAIVQPTCRIDAAAAGPHGIACSTGERIPHSSVAHSGEKPLDEASALLGAPARGARGVEFAGPVRAADPSSEAASGTSTRYLTLTY